MAMDLSTSGLDATSQVAIQAMLEAHDANRWADVVAVGDAWVDARGEMSVLASVWYSHGLLAVGRVEEALKWAESAQRLLPESEVNGKLAARMTYGQILASVGQFAKSRRVLKAVLADTAQFTAGEAKEQLGYITLAITEKWTKGWAFQEARLEREGRGYPSTVIPWDGKAKVPVAMLHEQGIGDAVLCARWLAEIEKITGHKPTWYGPSLMHRWVEPVAHVGDINTPLADGSHAIYALSCPHVLGISRPSEVHAPYAPPVLVRHRAPRMVNPRYLKVGLCWKGSATNMLDFERSYPADLFAPMWDAIEGVEFVNLCHDAEIPADAPFATRSFADVYDTGEVVSQLDLVVSVDTAVVHVAGSLGVPTIALLPTKLDWRYQWPFGGGTPFYPSVVAVRRQTSVDFSALIKGRQMLEDFVRAARKKRKVA